MTNNEIWLNSFKSLVEYINFYHAAPTSKTKAYAWARAQLNSYKQGELREDRYLLLNEMAPGIFVNGISKSIKLAIQNGTKYIDKYTGSSTNGVIGLDSSPEKYRDILNNFRITRFDDLFTLLIKESLGVRETKPRLVDIYNAIGMNQYETENSQSIVLNSNLNTISRLYRQCIKSKIGFGTIDLVNRILETSDLRELLRAAIIFTIIEDAAFKQIKVKQYLTIQKAIIEGIPIKELSATYGLTRALLYDRIKQGIRMLRHKCSLILTGRNLSYIEKLSPTLDQEYKIFNILYNSIDIPNKEARKPDLLVLFRLGFIGRIREHSSNIETELVKLDQLYTTVPDLMKLREPNNLDLVHSIDITKPSTKLDKTFTEPEAKPANIKIDIPNNSIKVLNLSNRAYNALMRAGIDNTADLSIIARDIDRLSNIRGIGANTISEIVDKLKVIESQYK